MRGSDGGSDKVHRHARAVTVPRILVPLPLHFVPGARATRVAAWIYVSRQSPAPMPRDRWNLRRG